MGQANRAPKPHYGRKFQISAHAIERFRERVEEEFAHRPDQDLMNLLDERITNAKRSEDVIDHHYRDTPSKVYVIESRKGVCSLAVVRENTCVTVLDEDMLDGNLAKGTWSKRAINTPFADALAGVKPSRGRKEEHLDSRAFLGLPKLPPNLTGTEEPPDPIAAAGIAHARALHAEHAAAARVVELEREIAVAKKTHTTAVETRILANDKLHALVTATPKEK